MTTLILTLMMFGEPPAIALPTVTPSRPVKRDAPTVAITLTGDGRLWLGRKQTTLDGIRKHLRGVSKKKPHVLLRVDTEAPWAHVQWLLIVCAEAKVWRTEFAVAKGRVRAWLPRDIKIAGLDPPPPERKVNIVVQGRKEKQAGWPGGAVFKPTTFIYRVGNSQVKQPGDIAALLVKAQKTARREKAVLTGEIKAGRKTPFRVVIEVHEALRKKEITQIDFFGPAGPDAKVRAAKALPYPKVNWLPR